LTFAGICACVAGVAIVQSRRKLIVSRRRHEADISAKRAHQLLAEFEADGKAWLWETDIEGRLTYISSQLANSIAGEGEDLIGVALTDLIITDTGEGFERTAGERTLGFHLSTRLAFAELMVRANVEGPPRWWSISGRPAYDEFKRFTGFRGVGTDLTEMRKSEAEINRLARYDALTGLPNRVVMHQTLDEAVRGDLRDRCALLLIDLDRFKNVNDTLGHPVGDALLAQVASRLTREVGHKGRCGRLGGDEFNVVLPGMVKHEELAELAKRIIAAMSQPYVIEGATISIGASIGIAIAPDHGDSADALVRNADLALYAAKYAGKGVHRFYEPAMHADAKDRRLLEQDLRLAIRDRHLHLVYQPVVDTRSEQIVGFEALVRWNHPTRGPVSPSVFIPIAEEIGLIEPICEWVLRSACTEAAQWPGNIRVAVNLSPLQFANAHLPVIVMSALANAQLTPDRLELEITESVFLNDSNSTDEMFDRLKAIGVRLALDDFGTGYSSLGYLKKAPFTKIKIDQSFVRGAAILGNRNAAIIKAIVSLAESLNMETTAEGAETHDEVALIRSLGCSHIQGYIFGRPMSAGDARHLIGRSKIEAKGYTSSRKPRTAILRSATLLMNGERVPVRLRNISADGAMAETDRVLVPGAPITLDFGGGEKVDGRISWTGDGRIGINFNEAFQLKAPVPKVTNTLLDRRTGSRR
jgi:diguanylate cyclase (GGDEF)-like protein